ncbi:MAG TPA: D-cysteine desulfhydrase family protein [Anaerolineales bacterium]|nr:D-cysteine desulfhydrase family protein [Anaerolineales bacterium]
MKPLPRIRIASLPTPVEKLPRLSAAVGGVVLSIKRDDQTGLAFGGNKTRKLEYLVAEAQANGARTLITTGAIQSNHCRQTAAAAARFGFECILVLAGEAGLDHGTTANLLLDQLLGAKIVWTSLTERDATLEAVFRDAWSAGKRPYLVPYGGSSPVGAAAYAFALQELLEQKTHPDTIVVASSSGGTQAGLALGKDLFGFHGKILGISIDEPAGRLKPRVANLANQIADLLDVKIHLDPDDIWVDDHYLGAGYGIPSPEEIEAVRLFARTEGILLDPVYTGRAAAAMLDLIHRGAFQPGEQVLFWHTGGNPALFAGRYQEILTG